MYPAYYNYYFIKFNIYTHIESSVLESMFLGWRGVGGGGRRVINKNIYKLIEIVACVCSGGSLYTDKEIAKLMNKSALEYTY